MFPLLRDFLPADGGRNCRWQERSVGRWSVSSLKRSKTWVHQRLILSVSLLSGCFSFFSFLSFVFQEKSTAHHTVSLVLEAKPQIYQSIIASPKKKNPAFALKWWSIFFFVPPCWTRERKSSIIFIFNLGQWKRKCSDCDSRKFHV